MDIHLADVALNAAIGAMVFAAVFGLGLRLCHRAGFSWRIVAIGTVVWLVLHLVLQNLLS